ncbi:MAG: VWA domain-containing protein [Pseudomonadales bacterium]|jgi:hypothetical protein
MSNQSLTPAQRAGDIKAFLEQVDRLPVRGQAMGNRLILSLDATASREPTWDQACYLQSELFEVLAPDQRLAIQLCFYRGFRELKHSGFCQTSEALHRLMQGVRCVGGHTQIKRLLNHGLAVHRETPLKGLIFIGDAVEESIDDLCHLAGECGLRQLPLFLFQEGFDPGAERAFKSMAQLSNGAYATFDLHHIQSLKDAFRGIATYATQGRKELAKLAKQSPSAAALLEQL